MHDSTGAVLQVGDRVLIEAEVVVLSRPHSNPADENLPCCTVQIITPDQPTYDDVMPAPIVERLSTKMLTKIP